MNSSVAIDSIKDLPAFNGQGDMRESILTLENAIAMAEQIEPMYNHYFADGVYVRELLIPKGAVVTGKVHKTKHVNMVIKGDVSIATDKGVVRIKAPAIFVSPPGTKKVAYAHEDSIFVNVHSTESTDLDEIEKEFVVGTHEEYLEFAENKLLEVS